MEETEKYKMDVLAMLRKRVTTAFEDPEIPRLAAGLSAVVQFIVCDDVLTFAIEDGHANFVESHVNPDVTVRADAAGWAKVLEVPPAPTFHSFTALQLANDVFNVDGEPIAIARCRPVLERIVEKVVLASAAVDGSIARDVTQITGKYYPVEIGGIRHNVYVERAGRGIPVLFLHTAGADSRQYFGQLADTRLAKSYSMWAVDLPFHGRSLPPDAWDGGSYKLTTDLYLSWCVAVLEQLVREPAYIVGGSMGAAMAMVIAARRPDLTHGIVAVEPPFRSKGRRNQFQHHAGVHGALHNAGYVRGLMSPTSPEIARRMAAWIYSQGAPGVYSGDLAFYSDEFDGEAIGPLIDCSRTPVVLLCGAYDYSATPADGGKLASVIKGARLVEMPGLGHFPMCEDPDRFRPYLVDALTKLDLA
ncbi:alpha/beta fold hydrolase [Paraburkholderia sediminicola]|uniref:alpha/beta fold hydrolase n=1 Tax=Paraburkholderia sediminicola TaxID=458836 RepID=UPI0038B85CD1